MDSCCQKERKIENDGVDIISDLPVSILEKIQSLLLTKDVIATSMLSKKWNTLSPFSNPPIKLDLEYSPLVKSQHCLNAFVSFVDKLFNSTFLNVPCIDTLKLHSEESFGDDKTISWVCAALRLKVREILLKVTLKQSEALFCGLSGCTTLTRLELVEEFRVLVPDGFRLPNLKMLLLDMVMFSRDDGDMFGKLISGCPNLEDMCLLDCDFRHWEESIHIRSSVLKKFTVMRCWIVIELDAPNLEVLQSSDCIRIQSSLKSLGEAHIDAGWVLLATNAYALYDVAALASACSSTVHLYLDSSAIVALQRSHAQLPTFQNLTSLALGCVIKSEGWPFLARLLLLTPNLEKIAFEKGFGDHEGGYLGFESLLPNPPLCLKLHLREIKFEVFKEEEDELKLVEYFLRNGKVIQKLKIHCLTCKGTTKISRLLMLPKYSKIDFQLSLDCQCVANSNMLSLFNRRSTTSDTSSMEE